MTQTGDPLHNALAERVNNTVKNGWLFETQDKTFRQVEELLVRAVELYNTVRPHQSLGMRTPLEEMQRLLSLAA
jgi:transposase InsO family protein